MGNSEPDEGISDDIVNGANKIETRNRGIRVSDRVCRQDSQYYHPSPWRWRGERVASGCSPWWTLLWERCFRTCKTCLRITLPTSHTPTLPISALLLSSTSHSPPYLSIFLIHSLTLFLSVSM